MYISRNYFLYCLIYEVGSYLFTVSLCFSTQLLVLY